MFMSEGNQSLRLKLMKKEVKEDVEKVVKEDVEKEVEEESMKVGLNREDGSC